MNIITYMYFNISIYIYKNVMHIITYMYFNIYI